MPFEKKYYLCVTKAEDVDSAGRPYNIEIEIKKESEVINLQQLVYLFANPILLRYAMLSLQYNAGLNYKAISSQNQENTATKETDFIYIPSISYDFMNKICYTGGKQFNYERLTPLTEYKINL